MDPLFIIFLALFIPGLLTVALIVAIVLPRALRDEQAQRRDAPDHPQPPDTPTL